MSDDELTAKRRWEIREPAVRRLVDSHAPAPRGTHYLVIKANSEGRPCAWGKAEEFDVAVRVADEQWAKHGEGGCGACYPGETVGNYEVHLVSSDPVGGRQKS